MDLLIYFLIGVPILFLLCITIAIKGKIFLPRFLQMLLVQVSLKSYLKPQLNWIRENIGEMYITEEVYQYMLRLIWFRVKFSQGMPFKCTLVTVAVCLKIPSSMQEQCFKFMLSNLTPSRSSIDSLTNNMEYNEIGVSKDHATEFKDLITAIHNHPDRFKIICHYKLT